MFLEFWFAVLACFTLSKIMRRHFCTPDYTGQTVWITGASSGIGEYLAYQFSKCGARLIISARNTPELERVRNSCSKPELVEVVTLDMGSFSDIKKITERTIKRLEKENRGVDVVVENAGISMRCKFAEYSFQNHCNMFDVNVHGPFLHMQCLVQHMAARKSGHIVGITSVAGKLASTHRSSYAGSKHALIGILDSMRAELRDEGIAVTNVMPGYIATNLSKNALVSGTGQKLGYTDKNIQNGLKPDYFARKSLQAIYRKEGQIQISSGLLIPLGIFMRNVCPDLSFLLLWKNGKNQAKALQKMK